MTKCPKSSKKTSKNIQNTGTPKISCITPNHHNTFFLIYFSGRQGPKMGERMVPGSAAASHLGLRRLGFGDGNITKEICGSKICWWTIVILWYTMIYHDILWYTVICYDILWYTVIYHDILWYTMIYYDILWYTMICYDIPWYAMIYHDILWYTMIYYGILWIYYYILFYIISWLHYWK